MGDYSLKILKDEKLHAELSKNARSRAEQFEQSKIVEVYEEYYKTVKERL